MPYEATTSYMGGHESLRTGGGRVSLSPGGALSSPPQLRLGADIPLPSGAASGRLRIMSTARDDEHSDRTAASPVLRSRRSRR